MHTTSSIPAHLRSQLKTGCIYTLSCPAAASSSGSSGGGGGSSSSSIRFLFLRIFGSLTFFQVLWVLLLNFFEPFSSTASTQRQGTSFFSRSLQLFCVCCCLVFKR